MTELTHEVKEAEDPLPDVTVLNIHESIASTFVSPSTAPSILTVGRSEGPGKLRSESIADFRSADTVASIGRAGAGTVYRRVQS
ncbi:MAG: hypothetical protein OXQ29_10260 [Rhodospirillaceae bacterium]|nr:hypothetical protein [Rhodospirillaceae bacterium]